ncbi:ATP-binding protein [Streptomyces sp. NPDC059104]|uniref:ATP-binding protein n=1 Tax=Streptomyces sp. NPDC059104 TaxID=3346729 RepID=UPI003694DFEF
MGEPGTSVRQSVPAELSSLIGREGELSRTAALLATARLVTLTGPAGIGKTRLAVRTVRTLGRDRGVDVVWADMPGVPADGSGALEAELVRRLDGREALLVLDGCEQLGAQAGPLVSALLVRLPRLRILATSQRAVGPAGEALLAVPPLAVPPPPVPPPPAPDAAPDPARRPVAEVAGYEAVRLYEERARGADPFFELTERNAGAVAALCRALDGIPGALELAAGRAHRYAPAEALRRLTADPLDFLSGGAGRAGGADALRTCSLAPPDERLLWDRLSVFAGSFDREAVVEVCGFGSLAPRRAAEALERIIPALLEEAGRPGRHRLPLSVRALAARRLALAPDGDGATAARRHRERYRATAERAARLWRSGEQREARALAVAELPELRAAMNPRAAAGPGGALEIAVALWFLWSPCGLVEEGRQHLERALALHPAPRPARALWLAAWLVASSGEAEAADPLLVEAWSAAVQEGEDACVAYLAHLRGLVALWRDRPWEAAAEFREALELLPAEPEFGPGPEALRAALTMALAHTDPASVPVEDGPPDGPVDLWARSWTGYAHAMVQRREGRPALARAELLRALEIQLLLGDGLGQALTAELLAELEADAGCYEESARLLGAVARIRPASACLPRAERVLRARMDPQAFRAALAEGARTPLRDLLPEL